MKKLIAVLVMFALVVVGAFAQPTIGGQLQMGVSVISGNSDANDISSGPVNIGGENNHVNVGFTGEKSGGMLRLYSARGALPGHFDWFAFIWWRPVELLKIQIGRNPDGDFGAAQIVDWGFTAEAKNGVAAVSDYGGGYYMAARSSAFYGGVSARSVNLSFFPLDALTINIGLPMPAAAEIQTQLLSDFNLNVVYAIESIGTLRVSFVGGAGLAKNAAASASPGDVFLNFHLIAIEGLGMELGFKTSIPGSGADPDMAFGLGVNYTGDGFGVKLRAGAAMPKKDDTTISVGLLPSFKLGDVTAFLHLGLGMNMAGSTTTTDWFVNPYISVPVGGATLYSGLRIYTVGDSVTGTPAIPKERVFFDLLFGFNYYF